MNSPREALAFGLKRFFQVLLCCLAALFLVRVVLVPSTAQSTGERELEDRIPKHLPIKVKIKKEKEKAFKDLKNEKWLTDFELEVTNTGDKPIYFLAILLEMPELVSESGRQLAYPLIYGRKELADLTSQVHDDDIPLAPGESYTFKIQEKWAKGMQQMRARINKPDPTRVQVRFQLINFGDGTGFMGIDGISVPQPTKSSCVEPKGRDGGGQVDSILPEQVPPASQILDSVSGTPATLLRATFSHAPGGGLADSSGPKPDICCPGTAYNSAGVRNLRLSAVSAGLSSRSRLRRVRIGTARAIYPKKTISSATMRWAGG